MIPAYQIRNKLVGMKQQLRKLAQLPTNFQSIAIRNDALCSPLCWHFWDESSWLAFAFPSAFALWCWMLPLHCMFCAKGDRIFIPAPAGRSYPHSVGNNIQSFLNSRWMWPCPGSIQSVCHNSNVAFKQWQATMTSTWPSAFMRPNGQTSGSIIGLLPRPAPLWVVWGTNQDMNFDELFAPKRLIHE